MGVAVLYPQDYLKDSCSRKALITYPSVKTPQNSNPNRSNRARRPSNRGKRSPPRSQSRSPPNRYTAPDLPATDLVRWEVKILKRGDVMSKAAPGPPSETVNKEDRSDPDLASTARLGPGPESVPTQIRLAMTNKDAALYAGSSAFVASPPPSSVPLPVFFTKKNVSLSNVDAAIDLRRILRLDMA